METNYSYPVNPDWDNDQLLAAMAVCNLTEAAYESKVKASDFLKAWQHYRQLFPAKMDQRQLDRDFKAASGYSIYLVQRQAEQAPTTTIKIR